MQLITYILFFACCYLLYTVLRWCNNPYRLGLVCGRKGSGKSLYLAYMCNRHKGFVYSNMGVGIELKSDYYNQDYPSGSLLLIDEAGLIHDNRCFKDFSPSAVEFYKQHRKKQISIVLASQSVDVDRKIRQLLDYIIVTKKLGFLIKLNTYERVIKVSDVAQQGTCLTDVERRVGLPKFITIPKTSHLYDTQFEISHSKKEV